MLRKVLGYCLVLCFCMPAAGILGAGATATAATLTAEQIVAKNIEARGGLKAWREIQTMTMTGKMDVGSKNNVQIPFVMKLKRPRMSRLEIQFGGKTALQVYDGKNGWKVRPYLGRNEVEPFTPAEMEKAAEQQELDGPLIDHEAKGIKVELVATEKVEGNDAYKLRLTLKDGSVHHLWVDAQSFLELKIEGIPRILDGKPHNVEVYYRNYADVGGVKVPYLLETVVSGVKPSRKMTIETYAMNPQLDANTFAKPEIPGGITPVVPQPRTAQVQAGNTISKGDANEKNR